MRVRLLGDAYYFGELLKKEYIGDDIEPGTPEKLVEVNQLMYAAVLIGMLVLCAIKFGILRLILF